jgi:hypothetical protein
MIELARKDGLALGLWADTLVLYYERTPTMESARTLDAEIAKAVTLHSRFTVLVAIAPSANTPSGDVRLSMQKTMQRYEAMNVALAYAIQGNGFGNAAARAAVSGMLMWVKPRYPAKVFADIRSAVEWLRLKDMTPTEESQRISDIEQFCLSEGSASFVSPATAHTGSD